MVRKLLFVIVTLALISGLFLLSCGPTKSSISGTYVCTKGGEEWLGSNVGNYYEFNSDGTFYLGTSKGGGGVGEWKREGDRIIFTAQSFGTNIAWKGEIKDNTIILEDGSTWVKQSKPSKEEAPAPPESITPTPTPEKATPTDLPGTTTVGDFSVALSDYRKEQQTSLYFTVTKTGDTGNGVETITVILTDDHDNKYQGDLNLRPDGSPDDFLALLPQDFVYVVGVNIKMPNTAPIMRIQLGETKDVAFKDVQFVKPTFKQDFGGASVDPEASVPLGQYLKLTIEGLEGSVVGWELPVTVINTEYNPIMMSVRVGLQFPDGNVVWNKAGTKSLTVSGSGHATLEPEIITLSQGLSGYIPTMLLIHCSEESTNQAELKMMAITPNEFPPLPARIAFVHHWSSIIYVMNVDGFGKTTLTTGGYGPAWSPDGTKIVFTEDKYGGGIGVMNGDGSQKKELIKGGHSPAWSPDGLRIAFDGGGQAAIYVMNADGSGKTLITTGWTPAWSPDGTKIAFDDYPYGSHGLGIYVIDDDGSGRTRLADGSDPAWSPDGTKIVYEGQAGDIWVMNADGSSKTKVGKGYNPAWSPDGYRIVFDGGGRDDKYIYWMHSDGSAKTKITEGRNPVWVGRTKLDIAPNTPVIDSTESPASTTSLQVANLERSELVELRRVVEEVLAQAKLIADEDEIRLLTQADTVLDAIERTPKRDIVREKTEEERLVLDTLGMLFAEGLRYWAKVFHNVDVPTPIGGVIAKAAEELGNRLAEWWWLGDLSLLEISQTDGSTVYITYDKSVGEIWVIADVKNPAGHVYMHIPVEPRLVSSGGGGNIVLSEGIRPVMETVRIAYRFGE